MNAYCAQVVHGTMGSGPAYIVGSLGDMVEEVQKCPTVSANYLTIVDTPTIGTNFETVTFDTPNHGLNVGDFVLVGDFPTASTEGTYERFWYMRVQAVPGTDGPNSGQRNTVNLETPAAPNTMDTAGYLGSARYLRDGTQAASANQYKCSVLPDEGVNPNIGGGGNTGLGRLVFKIVDAYAPESDSIEGGASPTYFADPYGKGSNVTDFLYEVRARGNTEVTVATTVTNAETNLVVSDVAELRVAPGDYILVATDTSLAAATTLADGCVGSGACAACTSAKCEYMLVLQVSTPTNTLTVTRNVQPNGPSTPGNLVAAANTGAVPFTQGISVVRLLTANYDTLQFMDAYSKTQLSSGNTNMMSASYRAMIGKGFSLVHSHRSPAMHASPCVGMPVSCFTRSPFECPATRVVR